ncbi:MAG TPA: hypothetical protein VLS89_02395 [Candidatus Nanopelagicales bacterium]|nr:hypothetical protein [Candidatus Nanopelagicales bacterium]
MPNSWSPRRAGRTAVVGAFMGLAAGACATRAVPSSFPADAAASPQAKEAPPAQVGLSLAEDPPLPGEPATRWPGLEQDAPDGGAHGHHAH